MVAPLLTLNSTHSSCKHFPGTHGTRQAVAAPGARIADLGGNPRNGCCSKYDLSQTPSPAPPSSRFPSPANICHCDLQLTYHASLAYKFYQLVFNWPFYNEKQPASYDKSEVMLFEFVDQRVSGGIVKVPQDVNSGQVRKGGGRGVACVWWLVADVNEIVPLIEQHGGRVVTDVLEEGSNGLYRYFEDPEGNVGVAYQFIGKVAAEEE